MDETGVDFLIVWALNVEHKGKHRIDHYITKQTYLEVALRRSAFFCDIVGDRKVRENLRV